MVWTFNFCSPFLTTDPVFNTNRSFLIGCLAAQMAVYSFVRILASCLYKGRAPTEDSDMEPGDNDPDRMAEKTEKNQAINYDGNLYNIEKISDYRLGAMTRSESNESTFHNSSPPASRDEYSLRRRARGGRKFLKFFEKIDIDDLERKFSAFFGHHAIAVAGCFMYCPFYPASVACLIYFFLGVLLLLFNNSKYRKPLVWLWGIACVINSGLLFSAGTFVGLTNYNLDLNDCYGNLIDL